ncbi:hypothetical protein [Streptomyces erythrochromogenes]|uniref:hypothetical protein n=1 Tax=Streptomyces erythrochromogenes TaxID=285574 RepID=UPI0038638EEB|nr:hypothetical protein OG489_31880 [Streptomyces erythrochromogenes]
MAADETALEVSDSADAALGRAGKVSQDAGRIEAWSIAWMIMALVIWGWFAFLMFADYGPEQGSRSLCRGPFVEPSPQDRVCRSDEMRQWPTLLGILALAAVATVTAAATMVYSKVLLRLAHGEASGPRSQG